MKKLFFTFLISLSVFSYGQAPQEISYQGVARNSSGSLLANQNIGIKLDLHQGSAGGAIVFSETHSKTTNAFGLFTLGIGSVNTAAFTLINWANGPYFLEVSMDPAGGSSYSSVGTQQFMSVPYALYAKTAGNATTYTAGAGINVSGNTILNTAPDQTVVINAAGSATVNGTYPNFTISTPTTQVYSAGNGINITGGVISNTATAITPTIVGTGATTVNGVYPNLTINTPTTQTYSAGNGIDITGGVISNTAAAVTPTIVGTGATTVNGVYPNLTINTPTVAPDLTVSLIGTGAATVNGTYPNFTVTVPNGTSLPTGLNGQFLFNNGTVWDTLPRTNLFFDGTNFGIGTTAPQANFHVVGAGRFDASISTPQIYTDNIKITGGNTGQVLTSDALGNGTWQAIPSPTLSYNNGTNVLTLTQGTVTTTATLSGTGSNTVSIVGSGLASVTPTTGSTFTVSVPNPTISIASGSLSISNGNSVAIPSPSLTVNSNSLTINGPGGNTVVLPTAATTSLTQGLNVTVSGTAPNYTVSAPAYSISIPGGNVVQITNGVSTSTSAINATNLTLTGTTNNILSAGGNTVALNTYTPGTGISMTGTAPNYTLSSPNQSLSINSNSLSITGGNTITLPTSSTTTITPGTNVTVAGSAPSYTVSSVTPTLNVIGGSLTGTYPTQTLTIPTSSTTVLTQSTGISVLGSAPSYTLVNTAPAVTQSLTGTGISSVTAAANTFTVNTPMPIYTATTGVLSFGGTNSVVATPSLSIVGNIIRSGPATNTITLPPAIVTGTGTGIATVTTAVNNFTVNVPSPTYTAATGVLSFGGTNTVVITPTLALTGTTLTSGAPTNSVNLSSLSVWSNSVGVLYPTTLTNSVGIGTSGPLTDKMEINYASTTANTHLHLKQTGADAFSRIKFTNAVAPSKFWLSTVTSAASDANSGYNFFYNNGSIGHNIFTVAGDGLVSVNTFSTMNNARFYVAGKVRIDSSLTMAAYNAPAGISAVNEGRIYFDRPSGKFKVSENGGAYVNLIGGGGPSPWIQGPGLITQNNLGDNVGIGTASPSSALHVYGMSDPLQITVESSGGNFRTGYNIKTVLNEWFIGQDGASATGFRITDKDATAVRLQIDQMGRVGIGTTFASEKLDVSGNIKLDSSLIWQGLSSMPPTSFGGNGQIYFDQPSGKFKVSENGGAYVDLIGSGSSPWIQGAGIITQNFIGDKVGIGTNTPAYKLDISENYSNNGGAAVNILTSSSSSGGANSGIYSDLLGSASGNYISGYFRSEALGGSTGSPLGVKGLGVGNSSTSATGVSGTAMNGNQNTGVYGYGAGAAGTTNYGVFGEVAGPGFAGYFTGGPTLVDGKFVLWPQASVPTAFAGQGSIYYDNAAQKFKVSENGNPYIDLISGAGSGWSLSGNSLTGAEFLGSTNAQDVVFKSAGTELMRLKSSNAITFTAGQYSMTASTSGNPAFTLTGPNFQSTQMNIKTTAAVTGVGNLGSIGFSDGTNSTTQAYIQGQREAGGGVVGDLPTALIFYTTADGSGTEGERMRINNAGKVGIGTTLPSAMLHALNAATTGSSGRFENNSSTNTADAVFVTNSGTGAAVHAVSATTSTLSLWLESGHIKSTQATAPTTSSISVSGITSVTPSISSGTDTKGTLTAVCTTTGNITPGNSVTIKVTFNKAYGIAPTVVATPTTDFGLMSYFVNSVTPGSFNITIKNNSTASFALTTFSFNYMVIE